MRYRDIRAIAYLIAMVIYLFVAFPLPMTFAVLFILVIYLICRFGIPRVRNKAIADEGVERRRREALRIAKIYLAPYTNIWTNLKLSNHHCSLKLTGGSTIYGMELNKPNRQFKIVSSRTHEWTDLWDMFCTSFNHNTTYEGLVNLCRLYDTTITETSPESGSVTAPAITGTSSAVKDKVDINNASEVELTALPGVSIVMAKKLVKKREEIGGFKSIEDVFLFLHLKAHMQKQLQDIICVNKMKGYTRIERNNERQIDL